jgi:hypothetical protein
MTVNPGAQDNAGAAPPPPPQAPPPQAPPPQAPPPPSMALRTYMMLRLAMIGVIVALALSVLLEIHRSDGCIQRSISAYYYTPTRAVFVGALVTLGTCMIVLWGKNMFEDGFLNIAGMLAPIVAFVPTSDANYCSVVTSGGVDLTEKAQQSSVAAAAAQAQTDKLIAAATQAIDNNIETLGLVIAGALVALLVLALIPNSTIVPRSLTHKFWIQDVSFIAPWAFAVLVWGIAAWRFKYHQEWFYANAHNWSATTMFGFIIAVVLTNAVVQAINWHNYGAAGTGHYPFWTVAYALVGVVMLAAAGVILYLGKGKHTSNTWFLNHWTFVVEATLISLFAVFWILQTVDRKNDGAPIDP